MAENNGDILVLGDGSWGTTLAKILTENLPSRRVRAWSHDLDYVRELNTTNENRKFLPGVKLPKALLFTNDGAEAFDNVSVVFAVVPSKFARLVYQRLKPHYKGAPVVCAAKGIETGSNMTCTAVVREVWGVDTYAALSGPSHAEELARGLPASVVIAGSDPSFNQSVQRMLSNPYFRIYTNPDIIGVELGGALKNVIAIAAGISDGLGFGDNAKSALVTRGIVEIRRLGNKLGARQETFSGLAGIGDLITTSYSSFGRNRKVGLQIAQGKTVEEIVSGMEMVAEGITTTQAVVEMARKLGVELPICEEIYSVLFEGKPARKGVYDLMSRGLKSEVEILD